MSKITLLFRHRFFKVVIVILVTLVATQYWISKLAISSSFFSFVASHYKSNFLVSTTIQNESLAINSSNTTIFSPPTLFKKSNECTFKPKKLSRKQVKKNFGENLALAKKKKSKFSHLPGGRWHPRGCTQKGKVAIIVPYRDRAEQLKVFLNYMHPFLQKQKLNYGIFIVEQTLKSKFNRAMLFNIGFLESERLEHFDCYIFHDLDLIPEDDRNHYSCSKKPIHLSAAVDKFNYKLPYYSIFGGASAIRSEDFWKVNGYSNLYFGWGGEDDDMWNRIHDVGLEVHRYPLQVARYTMNQDGHTQRDKANPSRLRLLKFSLRRRKKDGLNSMRYKLLKSEKMAGYTHFLVDIDIVKVMETIPKI